MRYTKTPLHRQDTDAESCSARKWKRSSPNGVLFTKDEIIRIEITLQIEDFTRGRITILVHTLMPNSKKP